MTISMPPRPLALLAAALTAASLVACGSDNDPTPEPPPPPPAASLPNILLIVLDDLGVDQLASFGYGGATPASTPNLDAIAQAGLRFRNTWSMPTCSPSRAAMFEGRFPSRTNVLNAIVANDLANSQVSPYEMTTPKILKAKGYINGLVGKMHMSGSDLNPANNPLGDGVMRDLGWDYFEGYLDGGPFPIDRTAGGVSSEGAYGCGFVPSLQDDPTHGADSGACYTAAGTCGEMSTLTVPTPGRACLEQGGIFDPGKSCQVQRPSYLNFSTQNGYYTGAWILNEANGVTRQQPASDPRSRGYRSILETDRAVAWLNQRNASQPWMLSVGYSAIHTPLQPPPNALLPAGYRDASGFSCTDSEQNRVISNQMLEALDHEIGRLMVESGLARRNADGSLDYRPAETNTVVVVIGDNGTYAPTVKAPFNPTRAKGFPYQTGVWVPLIVAGPMVNEPGREVPHMVNIADLYSLFGELADVDVRDEVPAGRQVDAQPLLAYLTDPAQPSIRTTNFTEMGTNITAVTSEPAPPCVIPSANVCAQIFPQQGVCEDQSGVWYGPGGVAGPEGLSSCCAVNAYLEQQGQQPVSILADSQQAIRNDGFKLVRLTSTSCETNLPQTVDEFYAINEAKPIPKLDNASSNLLAQPSMTPEQYQNYQRLQAELAAFDNSVVSCPGDGNSDGVVNQQDIENWRTFSTLNGGRSSWYDFNHDGVTNEADLAIIQQNLGKRCSPAA